MQVKLLAQYPPFGSKTPHCFSTSTGPFGLGNFGLDGSSFFAFFFFGSFSPSPSAFLFLLFFGAPSGVSLAALFLADLMRVSVGSSREMVAESSMGTSPSLSLSLVSSGLLPSLALWDASFASFFLRARSFFFCSHILIWEAATDLTMGFLQCLHWIRSGRSSIGRPVRKEDFRSGSISFVVGESGEGLRVVPPAFGLTILSDNYGYSREIVPCQLTIPLSVLRLRLLRNRFFQLESTRDFVFFR